MKIQRLLTPEESTRLEKLEKVIAAGEKAWIAAGKALIEIRDSEPPLYRTTHKTFEQYCKDRWGWTRQRAYQLIESGKIRDELPEECQKFLTSESHATALSKVPPEKRAQVLEVASASGKTTAKSIEAAAMEVCGETNKRTPDEAKLTPEPVEPPSPGGESDGSAGVRSADALSPAGKEALSQCRCAFEDLKLVIGMMEDQKVEAQDLAQTALQLSVTVKALHRYQKEL